METKNRVLVCGGRDYNDAYWVFLILDSYDRLIGGIETVVTGGARGADTLAESWARQRGKIVEVYHADWEHDGKAAGPIRNARMLKAGNPGTVIAFPGGSGTENMKRLARAAGVRLFEIERRPYAEV